MFVLSVCACEPQDHLVQVPSVPVDPNVRASAPPITSSSTTNPNLANKPEPRPTYSPEQGLDIEELVIGNGREAKSGDRIQVLYEGTLEDGTVFDSTATRGNQPVTFRIGQGQLIKGWEIGVPGMRVGGKRKLTIAPELGYGRTGAGGGGKIPPGSTLVFVIELVDVL
jgi:FKBP-type peptidyl-prolyl cis-trans isomerase